MYKVFIPRYRPIGIQEVETPRIYRQPGHKGGKVVSPTHRPPLVFTPRKDPWYSFVLEAESTPGPSAEGRIKSIKNPYDPTGNRNRDIPAYSVFLP